MKTTLKNKLLIAILTMSIAIPITTNGCQPQEETLPAAPATTALSSTLVPNMDLDVYIYIKQDSPTTLPADIIGAPFDVDVESLAIWGVRTENDFTFGAALTLTSDNQAASVHAQITPISDIWTMLSGNTIYAVQGSGTAAESLRAAITSNNFKYYDNSKALEALSRLPGGGATKLAAVAVAKPSKALISYIAKGANLEDMGMINLIMGIARLDVLVGGLYSPSQIDVARIAAAVESNSGIFNLDLGMLVLVKSGLPGFVVEPIVKQVLTGAEFTERSLGEFTVYQRSLDIEAGQPIPVLVRIENNYAFAAVSVKESYAETLISGINK